MPKLSDPAPDVHAPAASRSTIPGDFFCYHGWLAPGVRLFRAIGFPAKAAWVSLAFVIPLAVMLAFLFRSTWHEVDDTETERVGVGFVRPVLELIRVAQDRRAEALATGADLAAAQQRVQAAFAAVEQRQQSVGSALGTGESFAALKRAHEALMQSPRGAGIDETFRAHEAFVAGALTLLREIADSSQLALDPELDTYHLMNVAVLAGPRQVENTAKLRALGAVVLAGQSLSTAHRTWIDRWSAVREYLDAEVENSFQAVVRATPEVDRLVDMKGTDAASDAFNKAIDTQLAGEHPQGEAAAFGALGLKAQRQQDQLNQGLLDRLDQRLQQRVAGAEALFAVQLGVAAVFVAIAAYLMLAFYRVMHGGLGEVSSHLRQIAQGNLTTVPRPWGRDEAARLMLDLREMQLTLRRMVGRVRIASDAIVDASGEIAKGSMDLSSRTEQAAASLQQSAASMSQVADAVRSTADQTREASGVARRNAEAAAAGGRAMAEVVTTMDGIRESASRIGEIIGTIDAIAFQTNILALNAAVEAARAGESGRGFAVVAGEVRTLAQRSAGAAREIKALVGTSIDQSRDGTEVVRRAGTTIDEIVAASRQVDRLLDGISTSAREQSGGVGQVGAAVGELDRMTQQNAALVEQTAAAAAAMREQAHALAAEVARFRVPADAA